jgi:NAD-dependent deacetylase
MKIDSKTHVLVLTGAGVSAESGVPTFRGSNGLWENHPVERVASPEGFRADPALVWRFYSERRAGAIKVEPNPGHRALVDLESKLGDRFLLATQNVDGLHGRAGSKRMVEMHGNLFRTRCSECDLAAFHDECTYAAASLPTCKACESRGRSSLLRPDIVWFGEMLDPRDLERIQSFLERGARARLIFLAVGTSGQVYPAAGIVQIARHIGGETWLVNADAADNASSFDHFVKGPSGVILPGLFQYV